MPVIYVSEPIHPEVLRDIAENAELFVGYGPDAVKYETIADRVDAVMLRSEKFPAERIAASTQLKVIGRHGVGVDTVDVAAATARGIVVTYCPGGNANAVAEHVFAMLLSLLRKVCIGHHGLANDPWPKAKQHLVGEELHGRTLGIVGFGGIGKIVARIAQGFGMAVSVCDPFVKSLDDFSIRLVNLDTLLKESQVISLHTPLTPETRHLINENTLALMRSDAVIINTARSGLIDEKALCAALEARRIAGAALDVLDAEQGLSLNV